MHWGVALVTRTTYCRALRASHGAEEGRFKAEFVVLLTPKDGFHLLTNINLIVRPIKYRLRLHRPYPLVLRLLFNSTFYIDLLSQCLQRPQTPS
jgi:hypothetical protein